MYLLRAWRLSQPPGEDTLKAVAARFGIGPIELWRWERGDRRIPPGKVQAVSAITTIPVELLRPDIYRPVSVAEAARLLGGSATVYNGGV